MIGLEENSVNMVHNPTAHEVSTFKGERSKTETKVKQAALSANMLFSSKVFLGRVEARTCLGAASPRSQVLGRRGGGVRRFPCIGISSSKQANTSNPTWYHPSSSKNLSRNLIESKAARESASNRQTRYAQIPAAVVHGCRHGGKVRSKCRVCWWLLHLEELTQWFLYLQNLGRGMLESRVRNHFGRLKGRFAHPPAASCRALGHTR